MITVSVNAVFFITAPNNTCSFHAKSIFCKDFLTQLFLTLFHSILECAKNNFIFTLLPCTESTLVHVFYIVKRRNKLQFRIREVININFDCDFETFSAREIICLNGSRRKRAYLETCHICTE
jgi:hypothetical protein